MLILVQLLTQLMQRLLLGTTANENAAVSVVATVLLMQLLLLLKMLWMLQMVQWQRCTPSYTERIFLRPIFATDFCKFH